MRTNIKNQPCSCNECVYGVGTNVYYTCGYVDLCYFELIGIHSGNVLVSVAQDFFGRKGKELENLVKIEGSEEYVGKQDPDRRRKREWGWRIGGRACAGVA